MSVHKKMARAERAKQFMPFAALKGYSEALQRAEEEARHLYAETEEEDSGAEETECEWPRRESL